MYTSGGLLRTSINTYQQKKCRNTYQQQNQENKGDNVALPTRNVTAKNVTKPFQNSQDTYVQGEQRTLNILGEFLMDKVGKVTAIIQDHVQGLSIGEHKGLLDTPHVLLVGLSLPGIDWDASDGNGSRSMVLGAEDIATAPLDLHNRHDAHEEENNSVTIHWWLCISHTVDT